MKNDPKKTTTHKPRGGWDDDDDNSTLQIGKPVSVVPTMPGEAPPKPKPSAGSKHQAETMELLGYEELEAKNCDYEKKLVTDITQPGGARVKPPDNSLTDFCKASEHLPVSLIGSLLIVKLYLDVVWIMKAKALYAIEALAKHNDKYSQYFKKFLPQIKGIDLSEQVPNAQQLGNVLNQVCKSLEGGAAESKQPSGLDFNPVNIPAYQPQQQQAGGAAPNKSGSLLDDDFLGGGQPAQPAQPAKSGGFGFINAKSNPDQSPADSISSQPKSAGGFNFIKKNEPAPQPAPAPTGGTGGFNFIKSGTQSQPAPKAAADLLGGLDFSGGPAQPAPPQQSAGSLIMNAQPPAQPVKAAPNLMDMYNTAPPQQHHAPNSGLLGLDLGHPTGMPTQQQPNYGGGASLLGQFDGLNLGGYGQPQQTQPIQPQNGNPNMIRLEASALNAGPGNAAKPVDEREKAFDFLNM